MATKRCTSILGSLALAAMILTPAALANDDASGKKKDCDLTYTLKGWSAVYKTAKGEGTITCNNGQTANVVLSVHGGGATFGKTEIVEARARSRAFTRLTRSSAPTPRRRPMRASSRRAMYRS